MWQEILFNLVKFTFERGGKIAPRLVGFLAYQLFCTPPLKGRRMASRTKRVSEAAKTANLLVNGTRLKTYQWDKNSGSENGNNAPTVMLVHGWGGSAISMQSFIEPLRLAGFRVVSFDAPAHGGSSGKQTNLLETAAILKLVANEVGPLHAIVGHSFGGMVGAVSLLGKDEHPALQNVERLVLISSPDRLSDILSRYGAQFRMAPSVMFWLKNRIETLVGRSIETVSTSNCVTDSRISTLVIHDRDDKEVPVTDGKAIAADAPGTRFLETNGLGHRRILHSSSVAETVVRFLKDDDGIGISFEP